MSIARPAEREWQVQELVRTGPRTYPNGSSRGEKREMPCAQAPCAKCGSTRESCPLCPHQIRAYLHAPDPLERLATAEAALATIAKQFKSLRLNVATLTIGRATTVEQREEALRLTDEALNAIGAALDNKET